MNIKTTPSTQHIHGVSTLADTVNINNGTYIRSNTSRTLAAGEKNLILFFSGILLDIGDYFCILEAVFSDKTKDVRE